jgi:protein-S-isoprenylcysteine O-methyltransferase Ste14
MSALLVARILGLAAAIYWRLGSQGNPGPFDYFKTLSAFGVIQAAWVVFAFYWLIAALNRKTTQKREPPVKRMIHILFMVFAFYLFYANLGPYPFLNRRFLPELFWIAQLGAVMTVLGVAFAIWARNHIGRNWSGQVTIKEDHQLIRTGPYARIRHPIYTGLLFAVLGTAIAVGEYRAILAFVMILIGLAYKAKSEEALLAEHFGPAFEEHKRLTGFFLPRLN